MTGFKKIDAHTHITTEMIKREYYSKTNAYAVVMQFLDSFITDKIKEDSISVVENDSRLFICPCVDIHKDVPPQLSEIEKLIPRLRIVGLKIYFTYQSGRYDDEKMFPIYEFADKHNLSITFHTGSCSLVLPTDNDIEGSRAIYLEKIAEKFPKVNFILAHMGDPYYNETMRIVYEHENMFTDFSGAYEPGTPEGEDISWAIDTFAHAINQFPDSYKKILYGTDFCPPINLSCIEEYDETISRIFTPDQFEDVYFNNALRAFPKLKEYLKEELK